MPKTVETLTEHECSDLLWELWNKTDPERNHRRNLRNYTMALLMLDGGLRVGEVVQLRVHDLQINFEPVKALIVRPDISKSKRERIVPLSNRISEALCAMRFVYWTGNMNGPAGFAFFRTCSGKHFTVRQVERVIKRAALDSIDREIHPHILRHTFASRLMRVTNIRVVQELLGHKSLTSTQIYTHPNSVDLTAAIGKLGT